MKNEMTIRNWIINDDLIIPKDKFDLEYIYKVTSNDRNISEIDAVYNAGTEVRRAHIIAGQTLSKILKSKLTENCDFILDRDMSMISGDSHINLDEIGEVGLFRVVNISGELEIARNWLNRIDKV